MFNIYYTNNVNIHKTQLRYTQFFFCNEILSSNSYSDNYKTILLCLAQVL